MCCRPSPSCTLFLKGEEKYGGGVPLGRDDLWGASHLKDDKLRAVREARGCILETGYESPGVVHSPGNHTALATWGYDYN